MSTAVSAQETPPPAELWVVRLLRGGPYDFSRGMREQTGWKAHAAFMNGLVDAGLSFWAAPWRATRELSISARRLRKRTSANDLERILGRPVGRSW